MRRLLILTVFLAAAFAQSANAVGPITDLRPANPAELQSMAAAIQANTPTIPYTVASASVSPTLGLGVATATYYSITRKKVFEVYPNASVTLIADGRAPLDCSKTRAMPVFDVTAEQLGLVPANSCSLGKPTHLVLGQIPRISSRRTAANRGIDRFSKAANRCKSYPCLTRSHNRHYKRPVSRLLTAVKSAQRDVSWSYCSDNLAEMETAVTDHRNGVTDLIFYSFIRSRSDIAKAKRAIKRAAKESRTAWNSVKANCTFRPPN